MTNSGNKVMPAMQSPREEVKRAPNGITLTPFQLAEILFSRPSHLFDLSNVKDGDYDDVNVMSNSKLLVNAFICALDNINRRSSQADESFISFINYVTSRTNRMLRPIDVLLPNFLMNAHVAVALQNAGVDTTVVQKEFYKMHGTKKGLQNNACKAIRAHGRDFLFETAQKKSCIRGRKSEIEQLTRAISNPSVKNSAILIGEPGVGRTAVVEGFAQRLLKGRLDYDLMDKSVVIVDAKAVLSGAKDQAVFNRRIVAILREAEGSHGKIILFIKDVHLIFPDGSDDTAKKSTAGAVLKSMINERKLQCIATTTPKEYRKHFEELCDDDSERKLEAVVVKEPSKEEALVMLKETKERYESLYCVRILDDALEAAILLSIRHLPDRHLPEKAVSLLDEACLSVTGGRHQDRKSKDMLRSRSMNIKEDNKSKLESRSQKSHKRSLSLLHRINCFAKELLGGQGSMLDVPKPEERLSVDLTGRPTVGSKNIIEVVNRFTGLPTSKLGNPRSVDLASRLRGRVIGQDHVADVLEQSITSSSVDFSFRKKPLCSFLFVGGNGVGKTELAKALASELFGDEKAAFVSVDMSVYQAEQSFSRLMVESVGLEEGSTESVRRRLDMVVVLERIEMAHILFTNELHQFLQTGTVTDDQGRTLDFTDAVFIATSNLGSKYFRDVPTDANLWNESEDHIMQEVKSQLSTALIGLLDETFIFNPLSAEHLKQILSSQLSDLRNRLHQDGIELNVSDKAVDVMLEKAYISGCGARPIRRYIEKNVVTRLVEIMLDGEENDAITVVSIDAAEEANELNYHISKSRKSLALNS